MSETKWLFILLIICSCIQEPPTDEQRNPASIYDYKVITYGNNSIECRGYIGNQDAEGTLLETIPLGRTGQAPVRICGENIEDIEIGTYKY